MYLKGFSAVSLSGSRAVISYRHAQGTTDLQDPKLCFTLKFSRFYIFIVNISLTVLFVILLYLFFICWIVTPLCVDMSGCADTMMHVLRSEDSL